MEVVIGLYTLTGDMENSEKMAVDCLLLFDEDGNRTLDYGEFAKLVSRFLFGQTQAPRYVPRATSLTKFCFCFR